MANKIIGRVSQNGRNERLHAERPVHFVAKYFDIYVCFDDSAYHFNTLLTPFCNEIELDLEKMQEGGV